MDIISNSSSLASIPLIDKNGQGSCQLYIFTGKGGVGKTLASLAFTKTLQRRPGIQAVYCSFNKNLNENLADLCQTLKIPFLQLRSEESTKHYLAKRLKSQVIASWIIKTPFFQSLIRMIPGITYLLLMGDILDRLDRDNDKVIVLDSPSSGHVLTMFEANYNFKEIFGSGLIVKDIEKMQQLLSSPAFLKVFILTLPTLMAVHESIELRDHLKKLGISNTDLIANDSFSQIPYLIKEKGDDLPKFLQKKISLEQDVLSKYRDEFRAIIPHIDDDEEVHIVEKLISFLEGDER